jgi:hypothetical protein
VGQVQKRIQGQQEQQDVESVEFLLAMPLAERDTHETNYNCSYAAPYEDDATGHQVAVHSSGGHRPKALKLAWAAMQLQQGTMEDEAARCTHAKSNTRMTCQCLIQALSIAFLDLLAVCDAFDINPSVDDACGCNNLQSKTYVQTDLTECPSRSLMMLCLNASTTPATEIRTDIHMTSIQGDVGRMGTHRSCKRTPASFIYPGHAL